MLPVVDFYLPRGNWKASLASMMQPFTRFACEMAPERKVIKYVQAASSVNSTLWSMNRSSSALISNFSLFYSASKSSTRLRSFFAPAFFSFFRPQCILERSPRPVCSLSSEKSYFETSSVFANSELDRENADEG